MDTVTSGNTVSYALLSSCLRGPSLVKGIREYICTLVVLAWPLSFRYTPQVLRLSSLGKLAKPMQAAGV